MRKETAVIAIIVAAVAGYFVGNITTKPGEGGEQPAEGEGGPVAAVPPTAAQGAAGAEPVQRYKVPVGNSPFHGERDALVTIVEFSDFQ
jgi:hypothetical protein